MKVSINDDVTGEMKPKTLEQVVEELRKLFPVKDIQWRIGATNKDKTKGQFFPYVDARVIQKRLDDVLGVGNWKPEYKSLGLKNDVIICALSLRINGEWITKQDGSVISGDKNEEMAAKGGITDAFKRAAVVWGIARYLYSIPTPFVPIDQYKKPTTKLRLPDWAVPEGETQDDAPDQVENIEMTLEDAKNFVVITGNKAGFKMGSLQEVNLKFLLSSPKATAQEKAAAKIILAAKND